MVRTFAWLVLLQDKGVVNDGLAAVGIGRLSLIRNTTGVSIGMAQVMLPFAVLPMYAVMQRIDRRLLRRRRSLRRAAGGRLRQVYMPLSLPGVAAAAMLVFILSLGFFITPQLLGSPSQRARVAADLHAESPSSATGATAAAMGFVLLVVTLAVCCCSSAGCARAAAGPAGGERGRGPALAAAGLRALSRRASGWCCRRSSILPVSFSPRRARSFRCRRSWSRPVVRELLHRPALAGGAGNSLIVAVQATLVATVPARGGVRARRRAGCRRRLVDGVLLPTRRSCRHPARDRRSTTPSCAGAWPAPSPGWCSAHAVIGVPLVIRPVAREPQPARPQPRAGGGEPGRLAAGDAVAR